MGVKEFMSKIGFPTRDDSIPDDVTTDKYLRTLRRQRRLQMEEQEKIRLKKQISNYNKNRDRKYLWGFKDKPITQRKKPAKKVRFTDNSMLRKGKVKDKKMFFK